MKKYFVGLMSGTSLDGIDAALVAYTDSSFELLSSHFQPYPAQFKTALGAVCCTENVNLKSLAVLDAELGILFGQTVNKLLENTSFDPKTITAIGSHGQTIYHSPNTQPTNSLQIGDPNRIAEITGIITVADFRRRDMALGGQGAPLVPGFHQMIFSHPEENRVIVNIGGIANITTLPRKSEQAIKGFDVGPGNGLLDAWISLHLGRDYDDGGTWARSGRLNVDLLKMFKDDTYFTAPPPKSTGKEYFSIDWLKSKLAQFGRTVAPQDVQQTLSFLSTESISDGIQMAGFKPDRILICGGGAHNDFLLENLRDLSPCPVETTSAFGVDPDWVEACAFSWLAKQRIDGLTGNIASVTGAKEPTVLGAIYPGR